MFVKFILVISHISCLSLLLLRSISYTDKQFIYLPADGYLGLEFLAIYYWGLQTKGPAPCFYKTFYWKAATPICFTLSVAALRLQ